jgi:hypothetical protein
MMIEMINRQVEILFNKIMMEIMKTIFDEVVLLIVVVSVNEEVSFTISQKISARTKIIVT